jgi:hypothetical protein
MAGGMEAATLGLSHSMRRALASALSRFAPTTRERGRRYAARGQVVEIIVASDHVQATVAGSALYDVIWEYASGTWDASCTCPVGYACKHAYAAACVLLEDTDGDAQAAEARPSPDLLDAVRAAPSAWERQHVLARLLAGTRLAALTGYGSPLLEFLGEPDPELFCWRVADTIAALAGGWLPAPLEPYRDRSDLAARFAERRRGELVRDLIGWTSRLATTCERSVRVTLGLARNGVGEPVVRAEARVTSAKLNDEPRSSHQLQQLRSQALRDPTLLPPEQTALLIWLTDRGLGGSEPYLADDPLRAAALPGLLERIAGSPLATWGTALDADLAARAGVAPGDPVRLSAVPARLLPDLATHDGLASVALRFLWPDGRAAGLGEALFLPRHDATGTPVSLVLHGGEFSLVASEPPYTIQQRLAAGPLLLDPAEHASTLRRLATALPHVRDRLRERTRVHAVRPVVLLDLDDGDRLLVRALAHTGEWRPTAPPAADAVIFELLPGEGWARTAAPHGDGAYGPMGQADAGWWQCCSRKHFDCSLASVRMCPCIHEAGTNACQPVNPPVVSLLYLCTSPC